MKNLFRVLLVIVFLAVATVTPGFAKTSWNANSVWPPKNLHSVGLTDFAEQVKKATNGDLDIVVHTGGALGFKGPELLKAVRDGLVPVSDMLISGVAGDEKLFGVTTLPFLVRNPDELRLMFNISRPYFEKGMVEKWGQKILYTGPWPASGIWTKKKVLTLEDFKGLKTRTFDKNGSLSMEAVGATPLALPFSEVYTSLQTGLIDAVMTSTPTAVDSRFWEVLKYYTPLNISTGVDMVNVNLKAFKKLPKAQQDILVKIGKEKEEAMWVKAKVWDEEQEAISNKNGIETVKPSDKFISELEKITEIIRAEWLKTAPSDGKKIYNELMKKVKR